MEVMASFSVLQDKCDSEEESKNKDINEDVSSGSKSPSSISLEKSDKHHVSSTLPAKNNNHGMFKMCSRS